MELDNKLPIDHKNYNFRERRIAKLWKNGKICIKGNQDSDW